MNRPNTKTATALVTLGVLLAFGSSGARLHAHEDGHAHADGHDHTRAVEAKSPAAPGMAAVTGEVVDLACFMAHGGRGADHKKCAQKCVLGGAPMGLLMADGAVYLLLENHGQSKPYKAAQQLAGQMAKVTGKQVVKGGVQAILLESVEKSG